MTFCWENGSRVRKLRQGIHDPGVGRGRIIISQPEIKKIAEEVYRLCGARRSGQEGQKSLQPLRAVSTEVHIGHEERRHRLSF